MSQGQAPLSADLQPLLEALAAGESGARDELLTRTLDRLTRFARRQLRQFPAVARWEQTDDVVQGVAQRLNRALQTVRPRTPRDYFNLCGEMIRRELIDLKRKHFGPEGVGANHGSPSPADDSHQPHAEKSDSTHDAEKLARWTDLHESIARLPDELVEVFNLVWYQGLTHAESAEILGVSTKVIQRRWREARLKLHHLVEDGKI